VEAKTLLTVMEDPSLSETERPKYLNLVAMALSALSQPGNLRKVKQELESSLIKPYAVWRKSGYLESCL
jgi:hypothetical protein